MKIISVYQPLCHFIVWLRIIQLSTNPRSSCVTGIYSGPCSTNFKGREDDYYSNIIKKTSVTIPTKDESELHTTLEKKKTPGQQVIGNSCV